MIKQIAHSMSPPLRILACKVMTDKVVYVVSRCVVGMETIHTIYEDQEEALEAMDRIEGATIQMIPFVPTKKKKEKNIFAMSPAEIVNKITSTKTPPPQ